MTSRWAPDPTGRHQERWWDGARWTDGVRDRGIENHDPLHPTPPTPATPVSAPSPVAPPASATPPPSPVPPATTAPSPPAERERAAWAGKMPVVGAAAVPGVPGSGPHAALPPPPTPEPVPQRVASPEAPAPTTTATRPAGRRWMAVAAIGIVAAIALVAAMISQSSGNDHRTGTSAKATTTGSKASRPAGPLEDRADAQNVDIEVTDPVGAAPATAPTVTAWTAPACPTAKTCFGKLMIVDGVLIALPDAAVNGDELVRAFDLATGRELWSAPAESALAITTRQGRGLVLQTARTDGSGGQYLFATDAMRVDPRTGAHLWQQPVPSQQLGPRSVDEDTILSGDGNDHGDPDAPTETETGIDARTGEVRWSIDDWGRKTQSVDDIRWNTSPTCGGHTFKFTDSSVAAINLDTGETDWSADIAIPEDTISAACSKTDVWFAGSWSATSRDAGNDSPTHAIYQVALKDGKVESQREITADLFGYVDGLLLTATPDVPDATDLLALDTHLRTAWRASKAFDSFSGVVFMDRQALYTNPGAPTAVDRSTGKILGRCRCGNDFVSEPAHQVSWATNGLIQAGGGAIEAFRLPDFVRSWSVKLTHRSKDAPPIAIGDGKVVVIDGQTIRALAAP